MDTVPNMTTTAIKRERWKYEISSDDLTNRDHADEIARELRTMTEEWLDEHLAVTSEEPKVTETSFQHDGQEPGVRVTVQATLPESAGEELQTQLRVRAKITSWKWL